MTNEEINADIRNKLSPVKNLIAFLKIRDSDALKNKQRFDRMLDLEIQHVENAIEDLCKIPFDYD